MRFFFLLVNFLKLEFEKNGKISKRYINIDKKMSEYNKRKKKVNKIKGNPLLFIFVLNKKEKYKYIKHKIQYMTDIKTYKVLQKI